MGASQSEAEYADWLALIRLPGIGAAGGRALLAHFGTPRGLLEADRSAWRAAGLPAATCDFQIQQAWTAAIAHDLAWLRHPDQH